MNHLPFNVGDPVKHLASRTVTGRVVRIMDVIPRRPLDTSTWYVVEWPSGDRSTIPSNALTSAVLS